MTWAVGDLVGGRYRLTREIAKGGMGCVWAAHHVQLDMPCAVKFMIPEALSTPALRERFHREATSAAKLRSPHVVRILDHGDWQNMPYIAMELLEGEDLARRLARHTRLDAEEVVSLSWQVARALTKAHAAGIIHRDLKPENIFIATDEDGETVKVLDFGIAKVRQPTALPSGTRTGAMLGSPFYISPEQASGTMEIDHRADLWSMAVVIYECVVGVRPFESDGLGDLLVRIMSKPLPVPSNEAPWLPRGFDDWWAKAASRDPAGRFASATELVEALASALDVDFVGSTTGPRTFPRHLVATPREIDISSSLAPTTPSHSLDFSLRQTASGASPLILTRPEPSPSSRRGLIVAGVFVVLMAAAVLFIVIRGQTEGSAASASSAPRPTLAALTEQHPVAASSASGTAAATSNGPAPSVAASSDGVSSPSAQPSATGVAQRPVVPRGQRSEPRSTVPRSSERSGEGPLGF